MMTGTRRRERLDGIQDALGQLPFGHGIESRHATGTIHQDGSIGVGSETASLRCHVIADDQVEALPDELLLRVVQHGLGFSREANQHLGRPLLGKGLQNVFGRFELDPSPGRSGFLELVVTGVPGESRPLRQP